jgi:type I restriction enzyme S subunit
MTKKTDTPAIRFKGFSDTWEQRKAIDIADYSKGNGYSKGDLTDAGTPIILYGRLYTKYQFAISEVDTFTVPRNGAVYSQGNEVIVPASGETADDIARASAVEKSGVLLGGDLNILRPFDFINPLFLALAISNGEPQKELAKKAQGKSVVHIHNTDIQEVTIAYPSRTEQDRIVSVFRQLDNLITLHQREYEKLHNIKKSMLEKMFPKNGSNVPEIRFKGFTEAWEQRKLGEVLSILKDGTHGTHQDAEEGPYLLSAKNIKNGQIIIDDSSDRKISEDEFNQIHTKFTLENGDILLTIVGSIGESAILENAGKFTFQRSVAFLRPSEEMTSRFLKTEIESVQFQKELNDRKSQSAQPGVYLGDLSKIPIYITSKEEQKKIGEYFSNLDHLITLHQRELEKLQNIKKSMLEKMFVSEEKRK